MSDETTPVPDLCPKCGAYWRCDHRPLPPVEARHGRFWARFDTEVEAV